MAAFSFALYYNLNKAFWPDFGGFFQKNHDFFCLEPFPTPPPGSFAQTNKDLAPREGE